MTHENILTAAPVNTVPKVAASVKNLSKKYSKKSEFAVKDINFELLTGEIVGLLGANGAGKSTTLKCITGMLKPTSGEIFINGVSLKNNPVKAKASFSFVTDNHSVFLKMTGIQYVSFMADVYGVPTAEREARFEALEKRFCLGDKTNSLISGYSHGMKQKICIIASLIHQPKLWILDEPMLGLDPASVDAVTGFMREYAQSGHTVLFSSHQMDIVKKLCDRVLIISGGRLKSDIDMKKALKENPDLNLDGYFKSDVLKEKSFCDAQAGEADIV